MPSWFAVMLLVVSGCGGGSLVGEFAGAIEGRDERFTVGIDAIEADGAVRGWVRIGEPPERGFPPPRPEVGYPEGATPNELAVLVENGVAGFDHPMRNATLVERKLTIPISFVDFWAEWCELLDGNPATGNAWSIAPDGCTVGRMPIDCGKLALLEPLGVCFCVVDRCDVVSTRSPASLMLTVEDGDHLSGRFSRASGTLRLTRVTRP
jgi:hypothetical protein